MKEKLVTSAVVAYAWSVGLASALLEQVALDAMNLEAGKCGGCGARGVYGKSFFWERRARRARRCESCDPPVELFPGGPRVPASRVAAYRGR